MVIESKSAEELALEMFLQEARNTRAFLSATHRAAVAGDDLLASEWANSARLHRRNVSTLARIIRAIRAEKKASGNPALQAIEVPPGLEPHRHTARVVSYGERKRFDDSDAGLSDLVKAFEERGFFVRRAKRSHDGSARVSFDLPFDREITLHIKPEGVGAHFFDEEAEK